MTATNTIENQTDQIDENSEKETETNVDENHQGEFTMDTTQGSEDDSESTEEGEDNPEVETDTGDGPEDDNGNIMIDSDGEENSRNKTSLEQVRLQTMKRLDSLRREIKNEVCTIEELSNDTSIAKKELKKLRDEQDELVSDILDIENGCFQLRLLSFDDPDKTTEVENNSESEDPKPTELPPDPGKSADSLNDLDITPSQFEKLTEAEINSVCDLEESMREGKFQYIKGIGPAAVDKITDALMTWRMKNPIPVAEDESEDSEENEESDDDLEDNDDESDDSSESEPEEEAGDIVDEL